MDLVHQSVRAIKPNTGGVIAIGNTVGRDDLILQMIEDLTAGQNLLVVDPRRMGKTSTLRRLCNSPGNDLDAVWIDLEGATTVQECFERIIGALRKHDDVWTRIKGILSSTLAWVEADIGLFKIKPAFADKPVTQLLADLIQEISQEYLKEGRRLIIAIDELPLAVRDIASNESVDAASEFLSRLRNLRQAAAGVGWILAGSIGFHHVLEDIGLTDGVVNNLQTVSTGPLASHWSTYLAECLLMGIGRDAAPTVPEELAELAGHIPFIVHQIAKVLDNGSGSIVTSEELQAAFQTFLFDLDASKAWTHMLSRLKDRTKAKILDYIAVNEPLGIKVLEQHFVDETVEDRDDLIAHLNHLRLDHYLERTVDNRYQWKYDVLRRIWIARRELES